MESRCRCRTKLLLATLAVALSVAQNLTGGEIDTTALPTLSPGMVELGIAGSMTVVAGVSDAMLMLRLGSFADIGFGLLGYEAQLAYSHLRFLDLLDLHGYVSLNQRLGSSGLVLSAAIGGGVRQELIGSFSQVRYPAGLSLGVRDLVAEHVALRIDYMFLRIMNDPVSDYNEHHVMVGVSMLFDAPR